MFSLEKPPPPKDLEIVDVQATYVILKWNPPEYYKAYEITGYNLEMRNFLDGSQLYTIVGTYRADEHGAMVKSLDPDTEYLFRAMSQRTGYKMGRTDTPLEVKTITSECLTLGRVRPSSNVELGLMRRT